MRKIVQYTDECVNHNFFSRIQQIRTAIPPSPHPEIPRVKVNSIKLINMYLKRGNSKNHLSTTMVYYLFIH